MCGIAGEVRFNHQPADENTVGAMTSALERRGPDGFGIFRHGSAVLGHRRLKVIDLSENAAQPMQDAELKLAIVFNGCIYNYSELREDLAEKGYRFFSTGDTEVILKAYHAWGADCLERLKGMFAFVILHLESGNVFLARDRLGIKPLYYQHTSDVFRFASTVPAILKAGDIDRSIDPVALNYYMTFHGIMPAPHTIFNGVRKLPQAHWMMLYPDGRSETHRYWQVSFRPEVSGNVEEWKERLLEKLKISVKRRLVSDVPVGVLLSGGIDSSLLVGLCDALGQQHIKTFSIGFEDAGGEAGNEFQYSDIIASHFATDHQKIFIPQQEVIEHLPDCIENMSEPMVSWDNIAFYLLSREVAKHIKVVQCGQGADELFAGYRWHVPLLQSKTPRTDFKRGWFDRSFEEYARIVHPELVSEDFSDGFIEEYYNQSSASSEFEKGLELDVASLITDDPVKRVDNNTMAWGLEARVPFLDHELVEFAATIPTEYKIKDGVGKWLLKEASRPLLPAEVIDRPKGYFPVPALKNLSGRTLDFMRDTVLSAQSLKQGIFHEDYVRELVDHPQSHMTPTGVSKLYQIAVFEHWMNANANVNDKLSPHQQPVAAYV